MEAASVVRNFRTTGADGRNYNITHYNLDMINSFGYWNELSVRIRDIRSSEKVMYRQVFRPD